MLREIKFRGKSIIGYKWVYGDLLHIGGGYIINHGSQKDYDISHDNKFAIQFYHEEVSVVFPDTVGQFTGLYDKNGIEIYEGDIINVNGKYQRLVKFIDEYACFCLARISDLDNNLETGYWQQVIPGWWNNPDREIEVCGNIYDSPELVKGDSHE